MANLAKQVTKKQVITALEHIMTHDISLKGSTKYDLEYKGKAFPPKEVVRYAAGLANIPNWEQMSLFGGESTNEPLKKMGFTIKNKLLEDINLAIISKYKNIVSEDNKKEIYKWKLLNTYKGRPESSADNFAEEITSINFGNLIYHIGIAVRNEISKEFPEEYREAFQNLFDESLSLENRIINFQERVSQIYKKLGKKLNHHHDERTISTFLTFKYPEKYTLYKNSFYKPYCNLLEISPESKNKKYVHYLSLIKNFIDNYINQDEELLNIKKQFITEDCYPDPNNLIFAQDILYQVLNSAEETDELLTLSTAMKEKNQALNQILYGPPGTGKTYNTIDKAISIINPVFDLKQDRAILKEEFDALSEAGRIEFTTFHQSMSYEDFIEGIKPIVDEDLEGNKTVIYDIEDGIFKKIANQAKKIEQVDKADIDWNNVDYYKMSLGGKNNPQEHSYCIHNNLGGISWGGDADLTELSQISDWTTYKNKFIERFPEVSEKSRFHIQASFTLFRMKEGDIVFATRGNHIIDAIGKVSGPYIFNDENPTSLLHFRKVDWFAKDLNLSPEKFLRKNVSQQSIYQFYKDDIKLDSLKELAGTKVSKLKNYVLIIDEINRGNVSQIFGELITLIEESKRLGNAEELKVTLPYSKKEFGVPANLYIIGTMNTADRSVEALDTALRRRFSFVEMMPEPKVVEQKDFTDFPRVQIMRKVNQRIELLLDKNHTLGHSYFMKGSLKSSFRNEIIPLLQEYFYNDCGKIGLILGKGFVREKEISKSNQQYLFADFETRNELEIVKSYELIPFDDNDFNFNTALETLLL